MYWKKHYSIIKELAITDFKLRYKNSILGYIWSFMKPLLLFITLYIVFSTFMRFPVENYPLFLLLGIIIWNFISESTLQGMNAIIAKSNILKK